VIHVLSWSVVRHVRRGVIDPNPPNPPNPRQYVNQQSGTTRNDRTAALVHLEMASEPPEQADHRPHRRPCWPPRAARSRGAPPAARRRSRIPAQVQLARPVLPEPGGIGVGACPAAVREDRRQLRPQLAALRLVGAVTLDCRRLATTQIL
jgi:hypothetical protein